MVTWYLIKVAVVWSPLFVFSSYFVLSFLKLVLAGRQFFYCHQLIQVNEFWLKNAYLIWHLSQSWRPRLEKEVIKQSFLWTKVAFSKLCKNNISMPSRYLSSTLYLDVSLVILLKDSVNFRIIFIRGAQCDQIVRISVHILAI